MRCRQRGRKSPPFCLALHRLHLHRIWCGTLSPGAKDHAVNFPVETTSYGLSSGGFGSALLCWTTRPPDREYGPSANVAFGGGRAIRGVCDGRAVAA